MTAAIYTTCTVNRRFFQTIKILKTDDSFGSPTELLTYTESAPMLMDAHSRIVTTKLNGNAYYDYDNKIYHCR